MMPLSAVIITFNEELNIARCIRSLKVVADEIIVLDSFSTDNTAILARSLGATVYQEKFRGYIGQKNLALQFATHNYVLSLDADEALDDRLTSSILEEKKSFSHQAYHMKRCTNFCGHFIRHGLWYPDNKIRLFDKRIARWGGINPHDKIELDLGFKAHSLQGDILHYSFNSVDDLIRQNNRLSSIAASSHFIKGKRSSWFKMLIRPSWAFLNGYILRAGFLDGADGFFIAAHTAHYVFQKHSKLFHLQQSRNRQQQTPLIKSIQTAANQASGERKN